VRKAFGVVPVSRVKKRVNQAGSREAGIPGDAGDRAGRVGEAAAGSPGQGGAKLRRGGRPALPWLRGTPATGAAQ